MPVHVKRVYDPPSLKDGKRYLVERLWPRGVKKDSLRIDAWVKGAAPSDGLRRWFGHDPEKWHGFRRRYRQELDWNADALGPILEAARRGPVTLVYSARDEEHNSAVVLAEYLQERFHA